MNTRTAIRTAAAALLASAAILTTSNAQALSLHRPEPDTAMDPAQVNVHAAVVLLLVEGAQATTVAERRLIHHDLVQSMLDGQ